MNEKTNPDDKAKSIIVKMNKILLLKAQWINSVTFKCEKKKEY